METQKVPGVAEWARLRSGFEQMKIGLFEARCAACDNSFAKPELGDFAYGRFLFTGDRGTVYAYFEAIEHPVWDRLAAAAPTLNNRAKEGQLIQAACAYFADPVEEQRFHNDHVCPKCLSHNLASWDGRRLGEADIPVASFDRFASLSEQDQLYEAKAFYASFMAQQRTADDARNAHGLSTNVELRRNMREVSGHPSSAVRALLVVLAIVLACALVWVALWLL